MTMDPITGQGANKASHAAFVAGAAICEAAASTRTSAPGWRSRCATTRCRCDACNARLLPAPQHVVDLLVASAWHPAVADFYTGSFNDPDRFWQIASRPDRTESITKLLIEGAISATPLDWEAIMALAHARAAVQ
jgi:hypothetical protein